MKRAVFALACVAAAAVTTFLYENLTGTHEDGGYIRSVLIVLTLGSIYYQMWKPAVKEGEKRTG